MCVRMCPLSFEEAQDALEAREQTGRARVKHADEFDADFDAYPGARVPVYVPGPDGGLVTVTLTWGFSLEGKKGSVYNTRIESALEQLRQGRRGMWPTRSLAVDAWFPFGRFTRGIARKPY